VSEIEKPKADQEASDNAQAAKGTPPDAKSIGNTALKEAPKEC
jgi:hypothetical protein